MWARIEALESETAELRARLRVTAQTLIDAVGASGPENAEDAARRAVARLAALEERVAGRDTPPTDAELDAHDGYWMVLFANGRVVVDPMTWPSSRDWHARRGAVRWWSVGAKGLDARKGA